MMSRRFLAVAFTALLGLASALVLPSAAGAIELDQARTQGLVGERPDGLVGAVSAPTAEVKALVDTVNAARLAEYKSIAEKNNTPLEAVQAIAGEKQVQRAKENKWYVMDASGKWLKP